LYKYTFAMKGARKRSKKEFLFYRTIYIRNYHCKH
jgi:hypothetical protein